MGNEGAVAIDNKGIEIEVPVSFVDIHHTVSTALIVNLLQVSNQILQQQVGSANTDHAPFVVAKGHDISAEHPAVALIVFIDIGGCPEALILSFRPQIPVGLQIVVLSRTHLISIIATALRLVDVWLKPSSLLWEIVGLEGYEIAFYIVVQVDFLLQSRHNGFGRVQIVAHFVEYILGANLHSLDFQVDLF